MKKGFSYKRFKNILSLCIAYCFLIICFSACSKNNDNLPQITYSNIAGVNASESAMVDFYINNILTNSASINPGQAIGYFSVLPTTNTVDFRPSYTSSINASANINCNEGSFYSFFFGDGNNIVTTEDDRTLPQTGRVRLRFINMSSYLTGTVDFGLNGTTKILSGLANRTASTYYDVDPTITSIAVFNTGSSTPVVTTPTTMTAGHIYVFYVTGTTNATLSGKLLTQL